MKRKQKRKMTEDMKRGGGEEKEGDEMRKRK